MIVADAASIATEKSTFACMLMLHAATPTLAASARMPLGEQTVIHGLASLPTNLTAAAKPGLESTERGSADFFAGEENRLLLAVLEYWLSQPEIYNPLWLTGQTGVGKSLFAELLANMFRVEHRDSSVVVLPGSDFARSYAEAVKADATEELRVRYARAGLLVLDNLEQLAQKQAAQHELCKIIDELFARGGRLIAISNSSAGGDRPPVPALASRLSSGLLVPIQAPDLATRREILLTAARRHEVNFTAEALDRLAEALACAPPALTHAVVQLALEAEPKRQPIGLSHVQQYIDHDQADRRPTLARITTVVARRFSLKSAELRGPGRRRTLVQARGLAMLLARQLAGESYQKIGHHFGNRDHSTVMHACRQTEALIAADPPTRFAFEELSRKLNHR
jgi:chromosomal replication initiator protein